MYGMKTSQLDISVALEVHSISVQAKPNLGKHDILLLYMVAVQGQLNEKILLHDFEVYVLYCRKPCWVSIGGNLFP